MSCAIEATEIKKYRYQGIDAIRGLAIILMIFDHLAVVYAPDSFMLRNTVTRLSLPLFCLVAGSLIQYKPNFMRLGQVVLAGILASFLGAPLGIGQPDILLVLVFCMLALRYVVTDTLALSIWVIQPFTWPIPYTGYQPGTVLVLLFLGRVLDRMELHKVGVWNLPAPEAFAFFGRYPLAFYVGHLLLLRIITYFT